MSKTYMEYIDEISSDELYEGLLAYGFFAEKLPPIFTSVPFFKYCKDSNVNFSKGWNEHISFRVMRNINIPRVMGIPNPFKYQRLCSEISRNWDEIRNHFRNQTNGQAFCISRIHIRKKYREKCIFEMNYKNWRFDGNPETELLINGKNVSRLIVQADISNCFPSIYSHSIPWALVGKDNAKKTINEKCWYNSLDQLCSDMKNGQTHGLLVGPHTSNIISEIILTVIDKKLYDKGYRFIRHIDDYDCFISNNEEANLFLRDLEEALMEFDLSLNHKKTKIINLPIGIEENWKHVLSDLPTESKTGEVSYHNVNKFIDTALNLASEENNLAIINYAIKKLKCLNLSKNGKDLAAKRLMHMAVIYPYLMHLMEEYVFNPYNVEKEDIKIFAETIYEEAKIKNDFESMCYAIYYAIKYDFTIDTFQNNYQEEQRYIFSSKDCVLLLITWIYFMKQNNWNDRATQVKPIKKVAKSLKKGDMDRYWIFCYEVLSQGNLSGDWREMKKANVSFIEDFKNNMQ